MKTKYYINKNTLIISIDFSHNIDNNQNKVKSIRKYVNKILIDNKIKFHGNKIIIYKDGVLIGTFYLTNYYLSLTKLNKKNNYLTNENSYFYENNYIEINLNNKVKRKKILSI